MSPIRGAAIGAALLTASAVALVASPAHADIAQGSVSADASFGNSGCTGAPADNDVDNPLHNDSLPVTSSASSSGTLTGSSAGDTVALSAQVSGTSVVHGSGTGFGTFRTTVSASSSAVAADPSTTSCGDAYADADSSSEFSFLNQTAGWVSVSVTGSGNGVAYSVLDTTTDDPVVYTVVGGSGTAHHEVWLPAGRAAVEVEVGSEGRPAETGYPTRSSEKGTVQITYLGVGEAATKASGPGSSYAALPASVDCSTHTAVVRLSSKVKKAKKVGLMVDGVTYASPKPKAGNVTLVHLPVDGTLTLTALITPKTGKAVKVTRTYAACSED